MTDDTFRGPRRTGPGKSPFSAVRFLADPRRAALGFERWREATARAENSEVARYGAELADQWAMDTEIAAYNRGDDY